MTNRQPSIGSLSEVVGRNVRRVREARGLSQASFGEDVREYLDLVWSKQVVSTIERGKRPLDANELVAVALVLRTPVTSLLTAHGEWTDDREVVLSPEWSATVGELREAVAGPSEAAVMAEVRAAAMARVTKAVSAELMAATDSQVLGQGQINAPGGMA